MNNKRYETFVNTNIPWMSALPSHWDVWKLATRFPVIGSGTTPKSGNAEFYEDGGVPWLNTGDLNDSELNECEKALSQLAIDTHSTLKLYRHPSVVIALYGATIGKVAKLSFDTTVNQACCVISGKSEEELRHLFYTLLAAREHILSLSLGGGQPNISQDTVRSLRVPIPPIDEISAIVDFLDRETAKIDELIQKQEKLIELLNEKRKTAISRAVTRGLNSNTRMKDSGDSLLGLIPESWTAKPFKSVVKFQEGPGIMAEDFQQSGIPLLRVSCIKDRYTTLDGCMYLDPEKVQKKWNHFRVKSGDLLISASATMGTVTEVTPEVAGSVPYTGIIRLFPSDFINKDFLALFVVSDLFLTQIDLLKTGTAIQHFGPYHLKQMKIVVPPIPEQIEIMAQISKVISHIDELIMKAGSAILLMKEHRASLISAAVTGKIDVRSGINGN